MSVKKPNILIVVIDSMRCNGTPLALLLVVLFVVCVPLVPKPVGDFEPLLSGTS